MHAALPRLKKRPFLRDCSFALKFFYPSEMTNSMSKFVFAIKNQPSGAVAAHVLIRQRNVMNRLNSMLNQSIPKLQLVGSHIRRKQRETKSICPTKSLLLNISHFGIVGNASPYMDRLSCARSERHEKINFTQSQLYKDAWKQTVSVKFHRAGWA